MPKAAKDKVNLNRSAMKNAEKAYAFMNVTNESNETKETTAVSNNEQPSASPIVNEVRKMREEIREKIKEVENLNPSLCSSVSPSTDSNAQLSSLIERLSKVEAENAELRKLVEQMEKRLDILDGRNSSQQSQPTRTTVTQSVESSKANEQVAPEIIKPAATTQQSKAIDPELSSQVAPTSTPTPARESAEPKASSPTKEPTVSQAPSVSKEAAKSKAPSPAKEASVSQAPSAAKESTESKTESAAPIANTPAVAVNNDGAAASENKQAPKKKKKNKNKNKKKVEEDDDFDLFDDKNEDTEEKKRITEERLAAYAKKKENKPALIAKSSILLDIKVWDDETDMKALESSVRSIEMDGLLWGTAKLVPVAFGIKKLQINCVIEDDKVSTDLLEEKICELEEYVQSVDIAAFNKI